MADVWRGDILLHDNSLLKDIALVSQNVASSPAIPASSLRFLSAVETARIPLCLAAGPSLDVWTTSEETQSWFRSILLHHTSGDATASETAPTTGWWTQARSQAPIGILVQVESQPEDSKRPRVTEVLFYGTISIAGKGTLPTPPSSSPGHERPDAISELRVYALPLSSDLLYEPAKLPPKASAADSTRDFQYLLSPFNPASVSNDSQKRKLDIFDEAVRLQRRAKRNPGSSIAAAAAKAIDVPRPLTHRRSVSTDTKGTAPFPDFGPGSAGDALNRAPSRPVSRSPSVTSDTRPLSRRGPADNHASKRSTLSQVATVPLQPEEPTTETRNKDALSRVVLAAMRMHGLQQRKKSKSQRGSLAPGVESQEQMSEEVAAEEAAKDEEYKLIYHQTYKGAALALRKYMSSEPLHQQPDRLRDVVEKLLLIFCTDPLAEPPAAAKRSRQGGEVIATPGQKGLRVPGSGQPAGESPFDLPSGRAVGSTAKKTEVVHTGSPVSRRKGKEAETEGG